jgi:hypothetical protein
VSDHDVKTEKKSATRGLEDDVRKSAINELGDEVRNINIR